MLPPIKKCPKSQLPLSSSVIIASNEDLLTEILFRLPIKPLFQFKCVSKNWLSIITNPLLSHRKNINLCKNISGLYVVLRKMFMFKSEYDIIPLDKNNVSSAVSESLISDHSIQILQSCNGLLLCCSGKGIRDGKYDYFICNPTTRQFKTIPDPIYKSFVMRKGIESVYSVNLAFDPRTSPHYKVVCIYFSKTLEDHFDMEIYSSETGVWKRLGNSFTAEVNFKIGVYWNGAINWFSLWEGDGLYFNVNEERFGKIPMFPLPEGWEERRVMYFGESNDHLHLIEIYGPCTTKFNVYEMDKEYTGILYTRKNEESFVVLSVPGKAVHYNIEDETVEKIWDFDQGECDFECPSIFNWFDVFQYIESVSAV
ncbi:hypothetical protein RD792_005195 [Penstemon davidsonii]|uniref:F-box domain-containing protein n=1 Tax=Penstemon davidsonii TaxID=160366 RepID=A0ABR0DKL6_9LAMI|nr:hypothetical protein RD792_005195 [Penstemon davidsonii]